MSRLCPADPSIERKSAHRFGQQAKQRQLSFTVPSSGVGRRVCFSLPGIRNGAHRAAGCRTWNAALIYLHSVHRSWLCKRIPSSLKSVVDFIEFDGLATGVAANIERFE